MVGHSYSIVLLKIRGMMWKLRSGAWSKSGMDLGPGYGVSYTIFSFLGKVCVPLDDAGIVKFDPDGVPRVE